MGAAGRATAILVLALIGGFALASSTTASSGEDLLPDLDQAVPRDLEVQRVKTGDGTRYRLGFESAVMNLGDGPLIVDGTRTSGEKMRADQVIKSSDEDSRVRRDVGRLRFTRSEDHRHWHLLGFDRYELRLPDDGSLVTPDRKTGFCLGDRYDAVPGSTPPGGPDQAFYNTSCGLSQPKLRSLREGISVGYGDDYRAQLEGQFLDVTKVPAGRYLLVHRANQRRRLEETSYENNDASVLFELRRESGETPTVEVLESCSDTATCEG